MRVSVTLVLAVGLILAGTEAKRFGGGKSRPSGGYRPKPPPSRPKPTDHHDFLNAERGHSNPVRPSAPQQPHPQSNGPIGFEQFGNGNTHGSQPIGFDKVNPGGSHGSQPIGFDRVNSGVQNRPGGSAPQYPVGGPPPAYNSQGQYGGMEHPPAYPGRPVNAPPAYTPHYGSAPPAPQQGQYNPYQGQGYHGQQNYGNNFGNPYPQQQPSFGNYGQGSHPSYPGYGGTQNYGGSPFGTTNYNGNYNPNYNPNNFGYSSNPGYFGQGYQGQYGNQKPSRFGGLPIPIPIPIPIGGFGGGFGSSYGDHSYNHRLLNNFIKDKSDKPNSDNSTSVFVLNNSTVTPCTTDHFQYNKLKLTVVSCTAEFCTGVKMTTTTNVGNVESHHSTWLTMCLERNETWTVGGDKVDPSVSELRRENITVCRNVTAQNTTSVNATQVDSAVKTTTDANNTQVDSGVKNTTDANNTQVDSGVKNTTDATNTQVDSGVKNSTDATNTQVDSAVNNSTGTNSTVCEDVHCSWVEMCMTAIEIVDECSGSKCPFRRSGYRPCITVKMCRSPTTPLSTFASLNMTLYSADEYNNRQSQSQATNLTLISYHPPVICPPGVPSPGCPPPLSNSTKPPSL